MHKNESQRPQAYVELNYATERRHDTSHVSLKNVPVSDKLVDLKNRDYSLYIEVYPKFQFSASQYFNISDGGCHKNSSTVQIAYYLYGYVYDQLASLKHNNKCFLDSHPGNVFVLNDNFYWGEYGSYLETILNSTEANVSLRHSFNVTMMMFQDFLESCDKTSDPSFWLVHYVTRAFENYHRTTTEFSPVELFEEIREVISNQVFLFPQEVQEQFYQKVGPQVHSKILSLYSDVARLQADFNSLKSNHSETTEYLQARLKSREKLLKSQEKLLKSQEVEHKNSTENLQARLESQENHNKITTETLQFLMKQFQALNESKERPAQSVLEMLIQ